MRLRSRLLVILADAGHHAVAHKGVYRYLPSIHQTVFHLVCVTGHLVVHHHLIEHLFQIAQFNLYHRLCVLLADKLFYLLAAGDVDVIYDDALGVIGQVGHCLADDAVHQGLVQQTCAGVHQVWQIDGHHTVLGGHDASLPELIQLVFVAQSFNQRFQLIHRLYGIAIELYAILYLQHVELYSLFFQFVTGYLYAIYADVCMDKPTIQAGCYTGSGATTSEEVCNQHSFIRTGFDYSL